VCEGVKVTSCLVLTEAAKRGCLGHCFAVLRVGDFEVARSGGIWVAIGVMLQLLGAVSQFERALIKERQREGIAIAKAKKLYKGRKPALDKAAIAKLKQMATDGVSKVEIAEKLGISRASVYVYLLNP